MALATLINPQGQKVVVTSGSQEAQNYFGQGYQLMGSTGKYIPTSSTPAAPAPTPYSGLSPQQIQTNQQNQYSGYVQAGAAPTTPAAGSTFGTLAGQSTMPQNVNQILDLASMAKYQPSQYQRLPTGQVILNTGVQPIAGTTKPFVLPSGGTLPTPSSPLPATSLTANQQSLKNILGSNFDTSNIDSQTAGLLSLYGQSSTEDQLVKATQDKLLGAMGSLGNEGKDLQAELDKQGVGAAYEHVKELNLKAAQLKGQIEQFDAATLQGQSNIENQAIPTGLILGQQGQYNKQRDLTKIGMTSDLSATIALSQAYQGNATLGMELAKNAVDLKYMPILNQIDVLKTQLGFAVDNASTADARRFKVIDTLLSMRQTEVQKEADNAKQIASMAIQAAYNGAPLSLTTAVRQLTDPVAAATQLAQYLKGNLETVADNGTGTTPQGGFRTDRNNNPIAVSVPANGSNGYTKALDAAGVKWTYGDPFPDNPNMVTVKILGDATEGARAILSGSSAIQDWYINHTGKTILTQYGVKNNTDFARQSKDIQNAIIEGIHKAENGSASGQLGSQKLTPTQLQTGSTRAGVTTSEFSTLSPDVQNFFIRASASNIKDIQSAITQVKNGEVTAIIAKQQIDTLSLSTPVKEYLKTLIDNASPSTSQSQTSTSTGGFWSGLLSKLWSGFTGDIRQ